MVVQEIIVNRRIDRITLGGRLFLIDSTPDTTLELSDEELDGSTDLRCAVIRIRHDLDDQQWHETLLHELMHVAWHLTPLPHLLADEEETVIRALSPWLATLVRIRTAAP
jgi:hypothetical protein